MLQAEFEQKITVVILAGGRGRRMETADKGLVELDSWPLIQHVLNAVRPQNNNIVINANQNLARYRAFGYPVIADELSDFQGPLAGIATVMKAVTTPYILTLPCDAPYVAPDYQANMWQGVQTQQTDLVVAHDGQRLQSVHALIPTCLYPSLEQFLRSKMRKVDVWYSQHALGLVDMSAQAKMFHNLNTKEALARYAAELDACPV